jgi:bifunctional DNA-binding transcriptional regulator/antitoxin component of YhaV-PrlF toxin-antitoxin module
LTCNGQLTIPKLVRDARGRKPFDAIEVTIDMLSAQSLAVSSVLITDGIDLAI